MKRGIRPPFGGHPEGQKLLPFPDPNERQCEGCGVLYLLTAGQRAGVCWTCTNEEEARRQKAIKTGRYKGD